MPPPAIPITIREDPALVNFPRSARARGQMAGHNKEFTSPREATKKMDKCPGRKTMSRDETMPKEALMIMALICEMILGIRMIPIR